MEAISGRKTMQGIPPFYASPQRLPVLLRLDRGADPWEPSVAADQVLDRLNPTFCRLYASEGAA